MIARAQLWNVRLLKAEAFKSTNFTYLHQFEKHCKLILSGILNFVKGDQ